MAEIETVRLWLNGFIPRVVEGGRAVTAGAHVGKTMLPAPGLPNACFLTDQRDFSSEPGAPARTHSEIEIDVARGVILREFHRCSETIQVNCDSGEETCRKASSTEFMGFRNFSSSGDTITVEIKGSARNACLEVASIPISPSLDYAGMITIALLDRHQTAQVTFEGQIETYPAFEMYVMVNGEPAQTVFRAPVVPGRTPLNLAGAPGRSVQRTITISASLNRV